MSTAIARWGNSEAVRIPQETLRRAGLRKGDRVVFTINERGNIELVPEDQAHRRVAPARGVSYESLFKGWEGAAEDEGAQEGADAWPDEDLEGAEFEAWSR